MDGRWFLTLTVVDVFAREALAFVADRSLTGVKVGAALTPIVDLRHEAGSRFDETVVPTNYVSRLWPLEPGDDDEAPASRQLPS